MAERLGLEPGQTYELKIGASFANGTGRGQPRHPPPGRGPLPHQRGRPQQQAQAGPALHTIRYDFKPASVNPQQMGKLAVDSDRKVTVNVPNASNGEGTTNYSGHMKEANPKECILIIDPKTGEIRLERIASQIRVKKTRPEKAERGEVAAMIGQPQLPPAPLTGPTGPTETLEGGPTTTQGASAAPSSMPNRRPIPLSGRTSHASQGSSSSSRPFGRGSPAASRRSPSQALGGNSAHNSPNRPHPPHGRQVNSRPPPSHVHKPPPPPMPAVNTDPDDIMAGLGMPTLPNSGAVSKPRPSILAHKPAASSPHQHTKKPAPPKPAPPVQRPNTGGLSDSSSSDSSSSSSSSSDDDDDLALPSGPRPASPAPAAASRPPPPSMPMMDISEPSMPSLMDSPPMPQRAPPQPAAPSMPTMSQCLNDDLQLSDSDDSDI